MRRDKLTHMGHYGGMIEDILDLVEELKKDQKLDEILDRPGQVTHRVDRENKADYLLVEPV